MGGQPLPGLAWLRRVASADGAARGWSVRVNVSPQLLDELVRALAEELAPRVAAAIAAPASAEPWRLLDLVEAAAALGRSERWVRERVKTGALPVIHLDG